MTQDMQGKFNQSFNCDVLVRPEPLIQEAVAVVPGIDGRKMSKSYDNTVELFGPTKATRKRIMAIKADVEGGSALAEALSKHPLYFADLFVNLV